MLLSVQLMIPGSITTYAADMHVCRTLPVCATQYSTPLDHPAASYAAHTAAWHHRTHTPSEAGAHHRTQPMHMFLGFVSCKLYVGDHQNRGYLAPCCTLANCTCNFCPPSLWKHGQHQKQLLLVYLLVPTAACL